MLKFWPQQKTFSSTYITEVRIPITVHFTYHPPERKGWDYPGSAPSVEINRIAFYEKAELLENHGDQITEDLWNHLEKLERKST